MPELGPQKGAKRRKKGREESEGVMESSCQGFLASLILLRSASYVGHDVGHELRRAGRDFVREPSSPRL